MYRVHHRRTTCEYSDQCWRISSHPTRCTLHTQNIHTELMSWHLTQQVYLPRDAVLARYLLSSCVRLSVRVSQAGIVSKRMDESSWFLARKLPSTYPTLCCKEFQVSPKLDTSLWDFVNKTRRRRRRSSLLTTPIRQSTCRGCLLQVGQL